MRLGIGQVHRMLPVPFHVAPRPGPWRGFMGLGQQPGCFAGGFADNMQQWLQGISLPGGNAEADAAVGCGPNGGTPCASPADAANMALQIAASWCTEANNQAQFGCPSDPNCGDMGVAAAAPYVAAALAKFSQFPASVWTTEAANAASGNYYGPQPAGPCPPGTFYNTVAGGGFQCNAPNAAPQQYTGDSGPQVNILTGQPIPATITPSTATVNPTASSASPSAAGSSSPAASNAGTSTNTSASSASDPFAWLTQTSIGTVPNWMLLAGGLVAVMVLPSLLKGGR
jgi:hypothetical protein